MQQLRKKASIPVEPHFYDTVGCLQESIIIDILSPLLRLLELMYCSWDKKSNMKMSGK